MNVGPGSVFRGYRLVRKLGEGGMGSVWEALQPHLRRRVAVKIVARELHEQPALRRRFLQEARAHARIEHPNVVRVFDFEVTKNGEQLLVMELLEGIDLDARIRRDGPLSLTDARTLATKACAALEAAHAAHVVHRDVKAENLFLVGGSVGELKLIDFGIAREKHAGPRLTAPLELFGTPDYMSPEQLGGDDVDERGDLWALSVCLYYTLTGRFPFEADSLVARCSAIMRGAYARPSTLRAGLSPSVDAFFDRAFASDPTQRFASARALREAFHAATAPPATRALDRLEAPAPPRRRPLLGGLAAAIVVVVGGAAVANAAGALPLDALSTRAALVAAPSPSATASEGADDDAAVAVPPVVEAIADAGVDASDGGASADATPDRVRPPFPLRAARPAPRTAAPAPEAGIVPQAPPPPSDVVPTGDAEDPPPAVE